VKAGTDGRLRAFLALDLGPSARSRLLEALPRLKAGIAGVRWVRPEGIHLTLRFLGETGTETLERLATFVSKAAILYPSFESPLQGPLFFPRGRPRIVAVEAEFPESAFDLQRALEEAARALGFPWEERRFFPHLTLGRFETPPRRKKPPILSFGTAFFSSVVLFESRLGPGGSVYSPLRTFPLGEK
jgi:2'-5' RNA ligase